MNQRLQDRRKGKRYLWSLIVTLGLWIWVAGVVFGTDPEEVADVLITGGYLLLIVPLALAGWFSSALILGNTTAGALMALGLVVSIYLRIFNVGAWWVLVPWWGLVGCGVVLVLMRRKVDKDEADEYK